MKEEKILLDDETIEKLADVIVKKVNLNQPIYISMSQKLNHGQIFRLDVDTVQTIPQMEAQVFVIVL